MKVTLRIDDQTYDAMRRLAKGQRRSLTAEVNLALEEYVRQRSDDPPKQGKERKP